MMSSNVVNTQNRTRARHNEKLCTRVYAGNSRHAWKTGFFNWFYSCQQFKVSPLILYSDMGGVVGVGCLINKTVAPLFRYSFCRLPPGIYTSQLSALMGRRYLDFDGCIFFWLQCARPLQCRRACQSSLFWDAVVSNMPKKKSDLPRPSHQTCLFNCSGCQNAASSFLLFKKKKKDEKSLRVRTRPHAVGDLYG